MKTLEEPVFFEEVRLYLGVGHDFLYKELQKGRLKGRKIAGKWAVMPSDLKSYIDKLPNNQKRIKR